MLTQIPSEITVLQVAEALEGPITLNGCAIDTDASPAKAAVPCMGVWARAHRDLCALLAKTTFDALLADQRSSPQSEPACTKTRLPVFPRRSTDAGHRPPYRIRPYDRSAICWPTAPRANSTKAFTGSEGGSAEAIHSACDSG